MDREHEIGLVLGGGGAKGAYQVGALKALAEHGLLKNVTAISGTSAGGLNAAMLLGLDGIDIESNVEKMEKIWEDFKYNDFFGSSTDESIAERFATLGVGKLHYNIDDLKNNLSKGGFLKQDVIKKIIEGKIDIRKICENNIDLYITCKKFLSLDENEYVSHLVPDKIMPYDIRNLLELYVPHFVSDKFTPCDIRNLLLATSAIPVVYPPVRVDGVDYIDGGMWHKDPIMNQIILREGKSNVPYKALVDDGYKNIIIIQLNNKICFREEENLKECNVIEFNPLSVIPVIDTINFDKEKIEDWIKQGYKYANDQLDTNSNMVDKIKEETVQKKKKTNYRWGKSQPISDYEQLKNAMEINSDEIIITGNFADIIREAAKVENPYEYITKPIIYPTIVPPAIGMVKKIVSRVLSNDYSITFNNNFKKYNVFEYSKDKIALYLTK